MTPDLPDPAEAVDLKDLARRWQLELEQGERQDRSWYTDARDVVERYKSERRDAGRRRNTNAKRFNILYSNTEVLRAALFGRMAKPDVRRRFADPDPIARQAAVVIERALIYLADASDGSSAIGRALHDYLLPGRGVLRVEYEPVIGEQPATDPATGQPQLGPDGQPVMQQAIVDQKLREVYVYWQDYRQSPARTWPDVWWVAFRLAMTREDLEQFGEIGKTVPLNWEPNPAEKNGKEIAESLKRAEVWEIWDKRNKQRIHIVKGFDQALSADPDPYGLEDFFPMAEPLVSIPDNEDMVPTPEFLQYKDQADDLDEATARISRLTKALKRRGVYDQSVPELKRLATAGDNEFVPVANMAALSSKGGLAIAMQTEDISVVSRVILELGQIADVLIQKIYEVSGISDIMRGSTDPDETLGAQQLKLQSGSQRVKLRQRAVQKLIRDTYKIKAEILAEHFEPQTLQEMTGTQVTPEIMQILRSDQMRCYKIDIETDSTIFEDAQQEQASRTALITAMTQFMEVWGPMVQQNPALLDLAFEALAFGVRSFKAGRELEDVIDETKQKLQQTAQQVAQQPPKPNPDEAKAQADVAKSQSQIQIAQTKAQAEAARSQADIASTRLKGQVEAFKATTAQQTAQQKADADARKTAMDLQARGEKHEMEMRKIAVQHAADMAKVAATASQPSGDAR